MSEYDELVGKLRTYYGDDLACRMLLMDARHALEALAGEVERLTSDVDALGDNLEKVVAERDRLKAALDIAKAHAKQNQRARDLVSPYPNDHAKRIVWEKALYHEGKDLWDKLRKALGGDAS